MSSAEESKSKVVVLEHVIKKSDTGLVFYRKCTVEGQSYNVNNSVLLRDEGRYKLGYLLKIYCRTKGNERALVRWFFTDADFGQHVTEQQYSHEIFATSYTGKVAVSSLRKLVHVIWVANKDEIPESVPKDVYYVYRYFDHDKQALVLHRQQLLQIRYMPKPSPDSVGSSLSVKEKPDVDLSAISFSMPYTQNGSTFYKVCTIGKDKYKIGDCVLLGDRDGSSIRRIINFSYNHENRPIAMGQFIYYQNEVTLSAEERSAMHFQEVLVSNWKRELLISNIKRKLIVIHQNIFQPVPDNALKAVYFLKRYYDPFKKKIYPLAMPLTRSDFSIVPAPMEECSLIASLSEPVKSSSQVSCFRKCTLGEDKFSVGDFITLQSGSVCVKVMRLYYNEDHAVMDINKLFTIRNVPSADRGLLSTSLLFSAEMYFKVPCNLFFELVCVVFNSADIVNDATFVAGDFFDADSKELYKLWKPAKLIGTDEVPRPGTSLRTVFTKPAGNVEGSTEESPSSGSESEENDSGFTPIRKRRKKGHGKEEKVKKDNRELDDSKSEERLAKAKKSEKEEKVVTEQKQENKPKKKAVEVKKKYETTPSVSQDKDDKIKKKEGLFWELQDKEVVVSGPSSKPEFSWVKVGTVNARVGDCVFVKLTEGIQLGRITAIYKDFKNPLTDPVRLKLFRIYMEEEMFVSKRESASIHINEAFATDFVINALACQIDELVDVVYLKKKEKIPPQNEIPKGRLYIRRYYHPRRHLLRTLAEPLLSTDLSIIPQPHPPINGLSEENKDLNRKPNVPEGWRGLVKYTAEEETVPKVAVSGSEQGQSSEGGSVKVAVLEPKSVLSPAADSGALPLSGLADVPSEDRGKEASIVITSDSTNTSPVASFNKISIVEESDMNSETMTILPNNMISFTVCNEGDQTVNVIQQNSDQQTIQIVPGTSCEVPEISSNQSDSVPENQITILPASQQSVVEIVPQSAESTATNQIQIVTGDSNQVQVISADSSSIQIVPSTEVANSSAASFLPTIISSEQDLHTDMDVDITHAADGCITIAPVTTRRNNTAKFEDSYTKDGRVYYRKCHFKDETILQGESVYVRCNDQNPDSEDESWKLGRVMEFYQTKYPVVRLLWFYVVEEMVTSKNERAGIHPQEVFASQCDDEVEISSIESKANVIYLQKGETIPKVTEETNLFCRRFYDPYKHSIKALKNRLSATDITILPEPAVAAKRGRSSVPSAPQSADQEVRTPNTKRKKTSPSKKSGTPQKQSPRKHLATSSPRKHPATNSPRKTPATEPPRQMPFFSPQVKESVSKTTGTSDSSSVSVVETSERVIKEDKPKEDNPKEDKPKEDKPKLFFATEEETFGVAKTEAASNKNDEVELVTSPEPTVTPSENELSAPPSDPSETIPPQAVFISDPSETTTPQANLISIPPETPLPPVPTVTTPPEVPANSAEEKENQSVAEETTDTFLSPQEEKSCENMTETLGEEDSPENKVPAESAELNEKQQDPDAVSKTVSGGEADLHPESIDSQEPIPAKLPDPSLNVKSNNKVAEVEPHELKLCGNPVSDEAVEKENSVSDSCVTL